MKYEWYIYPSEKNKGKIYVEYIKGRDGESKLMNNLEEVYIWMLEVEGY